MKSARIVGGDGEDNYSDIPGAAVLRGRQEQGRSTATEDELLMRMVEAERRAPHQKVFSRTGLGSACTLSHPGWSDPPWDTIEEAFDGLLKRRLIVFGPRRTYVISEIGYEYYHQRRKSQLTY